MDKTITVLGIGNVLRVDDGVGVRVAEKLLAEYEFPANVAVYDGGTTGVALYPYIRESDHLIVVDAVHGPGEPGSVYRYGADDFKRSIPKKISLHDLGFVECLAMAEISDHLPESVTVIGVKPATIDRDGMELTDAVARRVDELAGMVIAELAALGAPATVRAERGAASKL
jgi:hydrogenase maturation protease